MKLRLAALLALTLLGACRHKGDLVEESGGGVYAVRSTCPIAGVPAGTCPNVPMTSGWPA